MVNRMIRFWVRSPVLYRNNRFIFVSFGVIVGSVIGVAVFVILYNAQHLRDHRYIDYLNDYFLWWPIASIGGAIFFFQGFWLQLRSTLHNLFTNKRNSWHRPGAVFYGGFAGSFLLAFGLAYRFKISFFYAADFIFLIIPFFHGLSRLACLNFGCCYGKPCTTGSLLNVSYTHPMSEPVRHGFPKGQHRHAAQLYEMILCILLGLGLQFLVGKVAAGKIFASYLVGYGVIRFSLEFVRDNTYETKIGQYSVWQFLSIAFILLGLLLWFLLPDTPALTFIPFSYNGHYLLLILFLSLWNALFVGITLGLHFRKPGESL